MARKLGEELKAYYASKAMPSEKLDALASLSWGPSVWKLSGALAASLLVVFTFYFLNVPMIEKVADEVKYNHLKKLPPEVLTSDYAEASQALDRLQFALVQSQRLKGRFDLVGARYCSVQGEIAAQLKLRNIDTGSHVTLYQFKLKDKTIEANQTFEFPRDQVNVHIWSEGPFGFALARDL